MLGEGTMEHLHERNQIIEEIWQIQCTAVASQLLQDPVKVDLYSLTKGIVADSHLKGV